MTIEELERKYKERMEQFDREYDNIAKQYKEKYGLTGLGLDGGNGIPELVELKKQYYKDVKEIVRQAKELKAEEDRQQ